MSARAPVALIATDSLHFDISDLPPLTFGLLFMGDVGPPLVLDNGPRGIGTGAHQRWRVPVVRARWAAPATSGPASSACAWAVAFTP